MTERTSPYEMEQLWLAQIARLTSESEATECPRELKELNGRIRLGRKMAKWCRTRAGYVRP